MEELLTSIADDDILEEISVRHVEEIEFCRFSDEILFAFSINDGGG